MNSKREIEYITEIVKLKAEVKKLKSRGCYSVEEMKHAIDEILACIDKHSNGIGIEISVESKTTQICGRPYTSHALKVTREI